MVGSSAESYRLAAALHALFRCEFWSSLPSRFWSVERLCQIEIDTSGAHSLRTIPQSKLWKAPMMNRRMLALMVQDIFWSRLMERMRLKRLEKSSGRSSKSSGKAVSYHESRTVTRPESSPHVSSLSLLLAFTIKTINRMWKSDESSEKPGHR